MIRSGFWTAFALVLLLCAPAQGQPLRIVAFGDSLMAGYGLPIEEGFPAQMEAWLEDQGLDVDIVNASVSGDTTAGGLARIAWTLDEPADAIMIELGANDMLRAIDPAVTRANLDGILEVAGNEGLPMLIAGMRAPGNYGEDYFNNFNSIFPDLAEKHEAFLYPQFLQGLSAAGRSIAEIAEVMQSDGLHPNARGVGLIVEDMGPEVLRWAKSFPAKAQ